MMCVFVIKIGLDKLALKSRVPIIAPVMGNVKMDIVIVQVARGQVTAVKSLYVLIYAATMGTVDRTAPVYALKATWAMTAVSR